MSWNTPRTWVAGELETAAVMNAQLRDNLLILATAIDTSAMKVQQINSTYVKTLAGLCMVLNVNVTAASNSGSTETTLISYTLPGGTLSAAGQSVRVTAWGTTTNSANAKIVVPYFGASPLNAFTGQINNSTAVAWFFEMIVSYVTNTTQTASREFHAGPAGAAGTNSDNRVNVQPTETMSGNIVIKTTATGGASSEITCLGQVVEAIY